MRIVQTVIFLLVILGLAAFLTLYVVDQREQVVVTRFGKVHTTVEEPGLKVKAPWDKVRRFPKTLQEWDDEPEELTTFEKTYIWVDTFARWRIVNPVLFFETTKTLDGAKARLSEIIGPEVRKTVARNTLIEVVRNSDRDMEITEQGFETMDQPTPAKVDHGRTKVTEGIRNKAAEELKDFGIELLDVKIKRINYVGRVRKSVYNRMIAERKQIAEKYRSEGRGEARKIKGEKERELKSISSEAQKQAEEIMGRADAAAAAIYAKAYSQAPDFYGFTKTMELYRQALDKDATLLLSTDSELFRYLKADKKP